MAIHILIEERVSENKFIDVSFRVAVVTNTVIAVAGIAGLVLNYFCILPDGISQWWFLGFLIGAGVFMGFCTALLIGIELMQVLIEFIRQLKRDEEE